MSKKNPITPSKTLTPSGIPDNMAYRQENSLVESAYRMTLTEKRVLTMGLARVKDFKEPWEFNPDHFDFSITAKEFGSLFNVENPRQALRRAAKQLLGRTIQFHPKEGIVDEVAWLDAVRYQEGVIRFRFSGSVTTRLKGQEMLRQGFTEANLLGIRRLSSMYTVRLYELMCRWKQWPRPTRVIDLDDIRIVTGTQKAHKRTADLRRYVIDPAVKEINEKTDLDVAYTTVKQGVPVVALEFTVTPKDQPDLFTGLEE